MKSTATPSTSALELLEDRIAPATLVVGGSGEGTHNYDDTAIFTSMATAAGSDTSIKSIGDFFNGAEDRYSISFAKGDKLLFENGAIDTNWFDLKAGTAKMFFHDANDDGLVQMNEVTGLSIGGATKFTFNGDISGDVVGNLSGTGTASVFMVGVENSHEVALQADSAITDSLITGTVEGSIYVGGKVDKLTIGGAVTSIKTGTAATGTGGGGDGDFFVMDTNYTISLSGLEPGEGNAGTGYFSTFNPAAKVAGGSISNVKVASIDALMAGNGGDGAAGGSISKITITQDDEGLTIVAGNGGHAIGVNAGAGGSVSGVSYTSSSSDIQEGEIYISGGGGGNSGTTEGGAVKQGNGGDGGYVDGISINALTANTPTSHVGVHVISINGGYGGEGKNGGAGGSVSNIASYTLIGDIEIKAGQGGYASNLAGTGGAGGAIDTIHAATGGSDSSIEIAGGEGGGVENAETSSGGRGGSVFDVALAAHEIEIEGGNGTEGKVGGAGGSVVGVSLLPYAPVSWINIDGGSGAEGENGASGSGGNVSDLDLINHYGNNLISLAGTKYLGSKFRGDAVISKPTAGENLVLDGSTAFKGNVTVSTYIPGNVVVTGTLDKDLTVQADVWGRIIFDPSAHIKGNFTVAGHASGIFLLETDNIGFSKLVPLTAEDLAAYVDGEVELGAGVESHDVEFHELGIFGANIGGGQGAGDSGSTVGGNGGSISKVYLSNVTRYDWDAAIPEEAPTLSFDIYAGEGGDGRSKAGVGGSLSGFTANLMSLTGVFGLGFSAGHGGNAGVQPEESAGIKADGGAGGSIKGLNVQFGQDRNEGDYTSSFRAGNGGDSYYAGKGGAGGSFSDSSFVFEGSNARVQAGEGGEGQTAGAGGSFTNLTLQGFGNEFDVDAGNAGESGNAGVGGSLKNVKINAYSGNTYNLTAGLGINGGAGGSIDGISHTYLMGNMGNTFLEPGHYKLSATGGQGGGFGPTGSAGGAIKNVNVLPVYSEMADSTIDGVALYAASGGSGLNKGGAGGNIEKVTILSSGVVSVFNPETGKYKKTTLSLDPENNYDRALLSTGSGGNGVEGTGGKGGDAKTVKWEPLNEFTRVLNLGFGTPNGQAIGVQTPYGSTSAS